MNEMKTVVGCIAVASAVLSGSAGVVRVPAERTGAAIQRAIDEVSAGGGGRVALEKAVYPSGTLYLKSNVELHLPDGAVIRGGDKAADYDDVVDARIGKRPEKSDKAFVACLFQTNVCITGGGVIDGQGVKFYDTTKFKWGMYAKPAQPRTRMIEFVGCRDVRFEDVTFKDSPGWTCWIRMCENVTAERVKIHADQLMINNDGFHIDGCRHVRIRRCDVRSGDDSVVMRAIVSPNGDSAVCEDMVVEDCTLSSHCQCVRLGCPSDGTIRNGVFRRLTMRGVNGVVSEHPVRYLQEGDSGNLTMENLLFEDCDIDVTSNPLMFHVEPGVALKAFGNTTFRNVRVRGVRPIRLEGNGLTQVENVRFENVTGEIREADAILLRSTKGISFDRFEVTSAKAPAEQPAKNESDTWERIR